MGSGWLGNLGFGLCQQLGRILKGGNGHEKHKKGGRELVVDEDWLVEPKRRGCEKPRIGRIQRIGQWLVVDDVVVGESGVKSIQFCFLVVMRL